MAVPAEHWLGLVRAAEEIASEDPDRAEALYRAGLEDCGGDGRYLAFYGTFLALVRRDPDGAERLFRQAVADPSPFVCNSYGCFLWKCRRDLDGAERLLRQAAAGPHEDALTRSNHEHVLATFLWEARRDAAAAAPLFRAATDVLRAAIDRMDRFETHRALLVDGARFFTATGDTARGLALVDAALRMPVLPDPEDPPVGSVHLLCWFLLYAHGGGATAEAAWDNAARLIGEGVAPFGPALDLEPNIAAALGSGHPRPDRLRALADIVRGTAPAAGPAIPER